MSQAHATQPQLPLVELLLVATLRGSPLRGGLLLVELPLGAALRGDLLRDNLQLVELPRSATLRGDLLPAAADTTKA